MAIDEQQIRQWISLYAPNNKSPNIAKVDTAQLDALLVHEDQITELAGALAETVAALNTTVDMVEALGQRVLALEGGTPPAPNGDFTWTPQQPKVGEVVTFTATSTTPNPVYTWDPPALTGNPATFAYQGTGTKTVQLLVNGVVVATKTLEVVASGPPPFSLPAFGVSVGSKSIYSRSPADQDRELDLCAEATPGGLIRVGSSPGNQTLVDAYLAKVRTRGLVPYLCLWGDDSSPPTSNIATFAAAQATKHPDAVFEILNEPDVKRWPPETAAAICKEATAAIRAARPNSYVVLGALMKWTFTPPDLTAAYWLRMVNWWKANGGIPAANACALHLYDPVDWNDPNNIWHQAYVVPNCVRAVMDANGMQTWPIISSETGGQVGNNGLTEAGQAQRLQGQLADGRPASMLVFSMLQDNDPGYELVRTDWTRRPAFDVLKAAAS